MPGSSRASVGRRADLRGRRRREHDRRGAGGQPGLTPDDVDRLPDSLFREGDVLLVSLEIPIETASRALRRGGDAGMLTDPESGPAPALPESRVRELLEDVMVLTPNRVEAMALAGVTPDRHVEPDSRRCGAA